eukprot:TRINITY_DN32188_c0_g1_i1.p1 TRINITY_DN32188_c0_g1~~TRINITY_DN32188_c0_g1_i1.p1  ORF type:complete len:1389 (+),score=233.65 TRINITY_DN32188_c0_g1_i1:111-4277(+)
MSDLQYGQAVTPSSWILYKVFTRKIFLVSWTRWRLQQALVWPSIHAIIHLGFWSFFKWMLDNELDTNDPNMPEIDEVMMIIFRTLTPLIMAMSMKTILDKIVMEVISEKESKMMIAQQVNGLPAWIYWLSYLTYFAVTSLVPTLVWTVMLLQTAFKGCGFVAVFVAIFLNFQHMFFSAIVIQTIFERAKTASAMSSVTLLIPLLPIGAGFAGVGDPVYIDILIVLFGFLPNFTMAFWCQAVVTLALQGKPWGFAENFFMRAELPFASGEFSFGVDKLPSPGQILFIFVGHLSIFACFAYWLSQVWQGELGAASPLCFCLPGRRKQEFTITVKSPDEECKESRAILELSNLCKTFESRTRTHKVVDDVTLDVYPRELFALLGHNGAGKTTIINMISGMLPITSGDARVMGTSCVEDIVLCRQNMSLCPQDNPMYESITVDNHLHFFAALRGSQNQQQEVTQVLEALGISEKRNAKCETLSGGQKRRLWVATSLLGRAALVFLDEPTSGMDPSSRRELWNLLLDMKGRGRSILFTTHYLEEADLLADRKAVLAKGKIKAVGTSKELKMQFGAGYHLRIMTPRAAPPSTLDQLTDLVIKHVPGAIKEQVPHVERSQSADAPMEVRYTLPSGAIASFGSLFLAIEAHTGQLQVIDFELAATSLEEVFMKLGKEGDDVAAKDAEFQILDQEHELSGRELQPSEYAKLLFRMRTTQTMMNKKVLLGTVALPVFFTVFSMLHTTVFFEKQKMMQGLYAMYPGLIAAVACMRLPYMLIEERERKIAQIMISMGMPRKVYWYTTLGHNALQVLAVTLSTPIVLAIGGEKCLDRGRWFVVLAASFLHVIPLSLFFFVVSCFCKTAENANKTLNLLNVIFGMLANILPSILWNFEQDEAPDVFASWIHSLCCFLSPYYLLPGTLVGVWQAGGGDPYKCFYVTEDHPYADECFRVPKDADFVYMAGAWVFMAPWIGQTFLCTVLALIAYQLTSPKKQSKQGLADFRSANSKADEDVKAEEERVCYASPDSEACLYRNLQHVYQDKKRTVHAVRGISLGIQHGECFGLLGPNGAGKTTTLGCLTGEIQPPTAGEVFVAGHSVTGSGAEKAFKHLGYCPQVDPLFLDLTGRQHLTFYGKMKGIADDKLDAEIDTLFQRLGFEPADRDKATGTYSGGMKRKLSLAIALIGPSKVLFLDEPSAAVDAGAKRLLWQAIKMRAKTKSVIITTHSMEEAEAVCDRIGIQVLGSLRCLGTPIHLKSKYGSGYQMEIRLKSTTAAEEKITFTSTDQVTSFVKSALSSEAQLLEAHDKCYLYQLPRFKVGGLSLGQVFKGLQEASEKYAIEEYSLVQPSLEQVFLRFAREQDGIVDHDESPGKNVLSAAAGVGKATEELDPPAVLIGSVN